MVIGVTGRYCAGKNVVTSRLADLGYYTVDVDGLGHVVLQEKADEIARRFGADILKGDGSVDRRGLGRVVFADPRALRDLESILHPEMARRVERETGEHDRIVINAAILFRMGLHRLCDFVLCVSAPFALRLIRAVRRDGLSFGEAMRRLTAQRDICPKRPSPAVDTIIVRNSGSLQATLGRLDRILVAKGAM